MPRSVRSTAAKPIAPQVIVRGSVTAEDKAALESSFRNAVEFRDISVKHLQNKWHSIKTRQSSDTAYDCPSWPYKQAALNGQLQEIEATLKHIFNVKVQHYGNE